MNNMTSEKIEEIIQVQDRETMGHCIGMKNMALEIENSYKFENHILSEAALLSDVGKIYISSYLLEKSSDLTSFEKEIIQNHSYYSYQIIKDWNLNPLVKSLVLYHHGKNISYINNNDNLPPFYEDLIELYTTLETIDAYQGLVEYRSYRYSICEPIDAYDILQKEGCHNKKVLDYIKNNYIY